MELSRAANEEPIFGQVDANGTPTASNEVANRFPVANIPGESSGNGWTDPTIQAYVSQVGTQATSTIGPNVLMKVMAGDQIAGQAIYYYQATVTNSKGGPTLITDLLGSLASAIAGGGATTGALRDAGSAATMTSQLNGSLPFGAAADPDANNATGDAPKAYLTVLFFDERFNFVSEGSMAYRVQTAGNGAAPLVIPPTRAPKNGYAYVYVSNESDEIVYFDNLQVSNVHGNILEENHYYAHGLKIAAISSGKMAVATEGEVINRFLYNDKELMDDGGLDWYDYGQRNYDPQIGRFQQVDPLTDIFPAWSPFQYAGNEPVGNVDLDGMESGGLPTPGGVFTGSGILMPGGGLGGLGGAGDGIAGLRIGGFALSGLNLVLHGVQAGPMPPRVDLTQTDLIAYSGDNDLYSRTDPNKPAGDWDHESDPTNDDERDLEKRMMRLIVDQSRDDPRVQRAAITMAQRFFDNTGGTFEDDGLDEAVDEDENFQGFTRNLMRRYNKALADAGGDPGKVGPFQIGNPAFNNEHNNTDGLGITIHGVSYVEVHLVKFEWTNQKAGEYRVDLKIDFYDTFGLDAEDINPHLFSPGTWYKADGGLKAWYKLQHNFNHVPLLTHVNEEQAAKMNWHTAVKKPGD